MPAPKLRAPAALRAVAAAALVAVTASCAPPPAPTPTTQAPPTTQAVKAPTTTTTTTTTTTLPLADPVPGFVRSHIAPRLEYTVSRAGLPADVDAALVAAAQSASSLSGITLEMSDAPSIGDGPATGEIRVRMGNLCPSEHAVGCAVVYGTSKHIVATDMSISDAMIGDHRLTAVVLHELGHALGLQHVDTTGYAPQVMGNNGEPLTAYQTGDRAGLAAAGLDAVAASQITTFGFGLAAEDPVRVVARYELTADHTDP